MSFWTKVIDIYERLDSASYYELIGVEPTASAAAIDERYFKLVHKLHPDKHARERDPQRREALTRIYARLGEAHKVLMAPRLRTEYDRVLTKGEVRLGGDHDVDNRPAEQDPKTDAGRKFLALGLGLLDKNDHQRARAQLELARQFEPDSKAIAAALGKLQALEDERAERFERAKRPSAPPPAVTGAAAAPSPVPDPANNEPSEPVAAVGSAPVSSAGIPIPLDALQVELERVRSATPDVILGVAPDASRDVARAVAQALIEKYHPKHFAADPQARAVALDIAKRVKQAYTDWREMRRELREARRGGVPRAKPPSSPLPTSPSRMLRGSGPVAALPAKTGSPPATPAKPSPATSTEPEPPPAPFDPPPPPNSNLGRALAFMASSNWLRAANSFQAATREHPRDNKIRGMYHVARGLQAKHERREADARKEFKNALMYDPNNADAKRELST